MAARLTVDAILPLHCSRHIAREIYCLYLCSYICFYNYINTYSYFYIRIEEYEFSNCFYFHFITTNLKYLTEFVAQNSNVPIGKLGIFLHVTYHWKELEERNTNLVLVFRYILLGKIEI